MARTNRLQTLTEITLLSGEEFLHLEKRTKRRFDYPLHRHEEIELNFIENFNGIRRVVGDSVEDVRGDRELVLVGSGLEHCWEEADSFSERDTHEITIQFSPTLFMGQVFNHPHMSPIIHMMLEGRRGLCFGPKAVELVLPDLRKLTNMEPGFFRFQKLMLILYLLGERGDYRVLSSESFARANTMDDNERIRAVTHYIHEHYAEPIRLETLAQIAYMSPSSFSHFFKLHTHKSVSDYILDERIGFAIRELVDTKKSVLEICYEAGFQNVSNFNRQFRKRRGCTPTEYRNGYLNARKRGENTIHEPEIDAQRAEIYPKK